MLISSKKAASNPRRVRGSRSPSHPSSSPAAAGERSLGCPADRLFALGSRARALGPLGVLVDADVHRRLLEPERWIIAGDYWAVAGERFTDTDTVVWLDLPRRLCWWRVCFRRNSVLEIACIKWIWRYPAHGRQTIALPREYAGTARLLQLRNRRQVQGFVSKVADLATAARLRRAIAVWRHPRPAQGPTCVVLPRIPNPTSSHLRRVARGSGAATDRPTRVR
jgi:hypothetical protein